MISVLKFHELTIEDRRSRYRNFIELPIDFVLLTLLFSEVSYIWLASILTAAFLIDLYLFGLQDEDSYDRQHFLKDIVTLIGVHLLSGLAIAPFVAEQLRVNTNLEGPLLYHISALMMLLFIYILWFMAIQIESKVSNQSVHWKWKKTGLFSSTKEKIK